jgi:uncharacterized protein (DUF362 family)
MLINQGVSMSRSLSRRDFLRISTLGMGALTGGRILSACNPAPTPAATAVPPTATIAATQPSVIPNPEIFQFYPKTSSKVIHSHHADAWAGEKLTLTALREMVDDSITNLTGLMDAKEAWTALFKPTEQIAIKVNAFQNSTIWTHVPLVQAVTDSLVEAGHPAEQIVIYDTTNYELETAGFTINQDGPGVRCYGTESHYKEGWKVDHADVQLSTILLDCDALINMPVLKSHMIAAMTYALKNHYGTVNNPGSLHGNINGKIAELNALPEIKGKTRLVIGDALEANLRYSNSWPYWKADWKGDSILMSYDPVAVDTVGAQILAAALEDDGFAARAIAGFDEAAKLEVGTNDPANINLIERKLG